MESVIRDLRYALRAFRANPALVVVAVASLAIGIGPNSVLFSLIDGVGFRPLPIDDPSGLVSVTSVTNEDRQGLMSYPEYLDVKSGTHVFADVCASGPGAFGISGDGRPPEVVMAATVSPTYLSTLGVRPVLGRVFLPEGLRYGL